MRRPVWIAPPACILLAATMSVAEPDPTASASGSAGQPAAPPKPLDAEPFPKERTPAPKADEWRDAEPVALTRNTTTCRAYRVREWIKVRCSGFTVAAVAMIAGPSEGASVFIDGAPGATKEERENNWFKRNGLTVQFPAIQGQGHVFQIFQFGESYDGPGTPEVKHILTEHWASGEPAPVVTLR
jgi:hypothetical protein